MPDAPEVSLITRFVSENPWPLAALLALVAGVMILTGLRDGVLSRVHRGIVPLILVPIVLAIAFAVTTSGERAKAVVRAFSDDVASSQPLGRIMQSVAPDAAFHVGSERNASLGADAIRRGVGRALNISIESHRITNLDAYSVESDRAVIHMTCFTKAGLGAARTRWVLEVRDRDGTWLITKMVFVDVNGRAPTGGYW